MQSSELKHPLVHIPNANLYKNMLKFGCDLILGSYSVNFRVGVGGEEWKDNGSPDPLSGTVQFYRNL
jgi:hypothetical protein